MLAERLHEDDLGATKTEAPPSTTTAEALECFLKLPPTSFGEPV